MLTTTDDKVKNIDGFKNIETLRIPITYYNQDFFHNLEAEVFCLIALSNSDVAGLRWQDVYEEIRIRFFTSIYEPIYYYHYHYVSGYINCAH